MFRNLTRRIWKRRRWVIGVSLAAFVALNVMTFRGSQIADVTAFVARSIEEERQEAYERWPEQPIDEDRLVGTFGRFGLPDRLTD